MNQTEIAVLRRIKLILGGKHCGRREMLALARAIERGDYMHSRPTLVSVPCEIPLDTVTVLL
jgi:hypothetical protein